MKHAKRIGALICVIAICFTLVTAPSAHAVGMLGPRALGALTAAGLMSLGIVASTGAMAIGHYFGWQAKPSTETVLQYNFPVTYQYISDYMNASTIKVDQGVTTIDGVVFDEVFVSPGTLTNGLKTNLFDFKTKWNIISGQSGITLASGVGTFDNIPLYQIGNDIRSASYVINIGTTPIGSGKIQAGDGGWDWIDWIGSNNSRYPSGALYPNYSFPYTVYFNKNGSSMNLTGQSSKGNSINFNVGSNQLILQPFNYTYTSGVVPTSPQDIPDDYGLSIQIPHSQLQTFYNAYPQYNVDSSVIDIQQDQIDIDQLTQAIFDQITSMDEIMAEWKSDGEPVPPGPAEDILEGVNTIIGQQNTQIAHQNQDMQIQQQQLQQQQQQLQEQQQISQDTSSIKDAIESVTETPTTEDLPDFKFDLRELFPFCIPFDIYNLLSALDAEPVAPHVQLPFVIESLNFRYDIDLDFSVFDTVAQVLRTMEFIVYALGLAWATGKVIKW